MPVIDGISDKRIETGEAFETRPLASLWSITPSAKPKMQGLAFLPSLYSEHDARDHKIQRERGQFVALVADVDKGNHSIEQIEAAVQTVADGSAYLVHSTANAVGGDMRWRVILPLDVPMAFDEWREAQEGLFHFMGSLGIEADGVTQRAGQISFLPNVPEFHDKTGEILRGQDGSPLFYDTRASDTEAHGLRIGQGPIAEAIAEVSRKRAEDDRLREQMRANVMRRRANRPANDGDSIIDAFNQANPVAEMLVRCGYEQSRRNEIDWRSPNQTSGSYATRVLGEKWISLSGSDAAAGLGERCESGCYGDAFDLFVHYDHRGDRSAAWAELCRERDARNRQHVAHNDVTPMRHPDDPGPDMADAAGEHRIDPLLGEIEVAELPKRRGDRALPVEWVGDVEAVIDGLWLVDDWLPAHGLGALYGHPGSGKSFLALDMGLRVALGWEIAGREVEQGLVLYVVAEGQTGFRNRMVAFRDHHQIGKETPFAFVPVAIDLQSPDGDRDKLIGAISDAADVAGQRPVLVVIDTLSKTFGAGKENTDDMATYVANCSAVADRFKCCTLIVHHRPKESESRDLRGHSSLKGGIETTIIVEGGAVKTATTLKQKDGPDNEKISFSLEVVELGINAKGKAVTTCIVEYRDDAPACADDPMKKLLAKMSDQARIVRTAIGDAIAQHGVPIGDPVPDDQYNAFSVGKMVEAGHAADSIKAALQTIVSGDPDKLADNIDRAKRRQIAGLKSKGIIGTWGDWIWLNY